MPPSSRKRNKGKDRKAKKLEKDEIERVKANGIWQGWKNLKVGCLHGRDNMTIPNDHPVSKFMDEFFIHWDDRRYGIELILNGMLKPHRQVWTDDDLRALAILTFTSIGTNMLLVDDDNVNKGALDIAKTITVLEHYDSSEGPDLSSSLYSGPAASKMRDIGNGTISTKRDLLKFYRKRISCKCLKRMHLEVRKSTPKMGKCSHCQEEKVRASLLVCSECMISQYCSKECQVAGIAAHQSDCCVYWQYAFHRELRLEVREVASDDLQGRLEAERRLQNVHEQLLENVELHLQGKMKDKKIDELKEQLRIRDDIIAKLESRR